jgi:serine/threonine protein kinase
LEKTIRRHFLSLMDSGLREFKYNYRHPKNCNHPTEAFMATLVGKTVGKYTLLELLGRGGMAEVYKARHPTLDRDVTVKVLHRHLADGEGFLARFEREAKAVAAMRHPHIVQIFDYEATEDANYMVMEFIDAGTLQDRVVALAKEKKYLPVREVLSVLGQVAEALDYAHGRGILHRDVKPSNILLDSSGNAFLTDFGIARILSSTQFTVTGVMVGTPAYMSPEQGAGGELTTASDIYALGVILYELLAGKVPFSSETTPLAIIHKHINEPPPNLRALRPDLPTAAEAVVLKALAKNPQDRYRTAGDLIRALEKALPEETIAKLDGSKEQSPVSLAQQSTQIMEDQPAPSRAQMPTEVMEISTDAEKSSPVSEEKPVRAEKAAPSKTPAKPTLPSRPNPLKSRRALFVAIGLVAAAVLAIVAWLLAGRSAGMICKTLDECIAVVNTMRMEGDLPGLVNALNAAIDHVAGDQHRPNAALWCDKGDAERELGRTADARASYTNCRDWTEGDPGLQPVRQRADDALSGLK